MSTSDPTAVKVSVLPSSTVLLPMGARTGLALTSVTWRVMSASAAARPSDTLTLKA